MFKIKKLYTFIILFFSFAFLFSENIDSPAYNFTIDLPEGFQLISSNNRDRFLFSSHILPCEMQISLDPKYKYTTYQKAGENIFRQLKASHKDMPFLWCEKKAQLSSVEFRVDGNYSGWVLVLELQDGWLTLTAYCRKMDAKLCEAMIISAFDSVYTDSGSFYVPGPVTTCLYNRNRPVQKSLNFDGERINFFIDEIDMQANNSVVNREFELLTHYLSTPYVVTAWQRYYRNIFRDAWQRLNSFSFEVKNVLEKKDLIKNKAAIATKILKHVQDFVYVRDHKGSDFVDLVTACVTSTGDCDSRSLLMSVVLAQLGVESVLFVSPEYSHAVCGVAVSGKGAKMRVGNMNYMVAETTAKVELGQIAADLADPRKWFATELYSLGSL